MRGKSTVQSSRREIMLRKLALISYIFQASVACVPSVISYLFVYQYAYKSLGPYVWVVWTVIFILLVIGLISVSSARSSLVMIHLLCEIILIPCAATFATESFLNLDTFCSIQQTSFYGCDASICPCVGTGSCGQGDLTEPGCEGCHAVPFPACNPFRTSTYYYTTIAVTGLVLLLSCIPCIFMDVLLLKERIYVFISNRARKTGIQVHVETQTRLLAAGDTPTVTPGTLQDMVSELLFVCDDPSCHVTANKCRFVLKERGYELPLNRNIADSLTAMNTIRARDDKNRRNSSNNWTSIPPHSQSTDCIPKNVCAESEHELHLHNMKQKSHHAQSPSPEDPEALYLEATVATGTCNPKHDRHD